MKRFIINELLLWKKESPRKPLLLRGVRQCGKTHALLKFAQSFDSYTYLNFEKNRDFKTFFKNDISPKTILQSIEFHLGTIINPSKHLLILDEIQECPRAITALKYFCEDMPELAVCCAGSHIGVSNNVESFPVGKISALNMYPMCFAEFLLNHSELRYKAIPKMIKNGFPPLADKMLYEIFKLYQFTGGLPEAVNAFITNKHDASLALVKVRKIHELLLLGYSSDFAKHCGPQNAQHIGLIFDNIPQQLQSVRDGSSKRYQFKSIIPNRSKYSQMAGPIEWLEKSGLSLRIKQLSAVRKPLKAHAKENFFRLFLFDIGLIHFMLDMPPNDILGQEAFSYKGFLAENYIAQELVTQGKKLYTLNEIRSEVEFLYDHEDGIIPIEVKAGKNLKSKSLLSFKERYSPKISIKFSARPLHFDKEQISIPLYLAPFLDEIIKHFQIAQASSSL